MPAPRIQELLGEHPAAAVVDFTPRTGNASVGTELLERGRNGRALDLMETAGVICLGDQAHLRGRNESWSRDLVFHVPARYAETLGGVSLRLSALLGFVMGDRVIVRLEAGDELSAPAPTRLSRVRRPGDGSDCACLLSGGLDSLAGAILLLEEGRRPLFVSHVTGNAITRRSQEHVAAALDARYGPQRYLPVAMFPTGRSEATYPFPDGDRRETSRRARSLFPLTVAACACAAGAGTEVYIPENGVLAAQLPLTRARIGSFTTRTTHPRWLAGLEVILGEVLEHEIAIRNPLSELTKGEVVRDVLLRHLPESAARGTVSCWAAGRGPVACGGCVPCLLRRLAFEHADMAPEATQLDPLALPDSVRGTDAFRNLASILTLVRDFLLLPDDRLFARYPEVAYLGEDAHRTLATVRRFALETERICLDRFGAAARLLGVA
jgi:hypothetical protein